MHFTCTLAVANLQESAIEDFSRGSITVRNMSKESTPSEEEPFLIIRTSSKNIETEYNLIGNIEGLLIQFLYEGRATVCLKEPSCNIIITKADPDELTAFILYLKKQLPADSPVHVSMAALKPPIPQIYLHGEEKYKLRMENIIGMNTNLDHFTDLEICGCTLELEGYQVSIAGAIKRMKNLTTLRLEYIDLHSSTFLEIESKELKQLRLCQCLTPLPIASLFKNDLCYKDSLVELCLNENNWSEIPNAIFEFRNLLKLSLNNNCLTELSDKFTNLSKLQVLEVSRNRIRQVHPSIFQMQNLLMLSLDSNRITELPKIPINSSSKLQVLSLSYNQLEHVPSSIFALQNLFQLSLCRISITELPDKFTNLSKLKILLLSRNRLTHIPPSIFSLQNLIKLLLNGNLINDLPNMLPNLPKLETLLLCENQLRYVPAIVFEMQNLSELSLSGNYITELPDKFINLPKLEYLSLTWNQLQYLPPSIFALHLNQLYIANNEFNFEIPPSVGSEVFEHPLQELSYRTILKHKLTVEEGMLPKRLLKDMDNYRQCVCGCKFVEGQEVSFVLNLNDILSFNFSNPDPNLRFPIRGKMCTSLKSCFIDHFTKYN